MRGLLEKSRVLNKLLQNASGYPEEFTDIVKVLGNLINSNVYVVNRDGRLVGYSLMDDLVCPEVDAFFSADMTITEDRSEALFKTSQTVLNLCYDTQDCVLDDFSGGCLYEGKVAAIVPIIVSGERRGTVVLTKFNHRDFSEEDTILAEYGAMVIGLEMLRASSEKTEEEARRKAAVQIAIGTLSYTEQEAIEHIFDELQGKEALLVASRIADRVGITRSVIVNALRKFESAGVIETKSLGMKGTFIRVLNDNLIEELNKKRKKT